MRPPRVGLPVDQRGSLIQIIHIISESEGAKPPQSLPLHVTSSLPSSQDRDDLF